MQRLSTVVWLMTALHAYSACGFVIPTVHTKVVSSATATSPALASVAGHQQKYQRRSQWTTSPTTSLRASSDGNSGAPSNLPFWLDPGTKGGAVFLSLVLFIVPIIGYNIIINVSGLDPSEVGIWIGVGFTVLSLFVWVGSYIFRVATKDMTYAKQLKDYEDAVIAKRFEELDEDEIQALVEDIERSEF
jgi:hypothetical protein